MPASLFDLTSRTSVTERLVQNRLVVAASNADTTLTAAQSIEALVTMTPASTDKTITTATAALIVAELGSTVQIGTSFELTLVNTASATSKLLLAVGSGCLLGGAAAMATVAAATSATYLGVVTAVDTPAVTFYRKGG
jgi:hypothetical protein